ncbi:2Fe-2S iron-sulfur cluster-binding protein [Halalkalicoccus subterraneus]|uniref:2Fe-2S iron-sulfur cluster-binding protein n=1 Tax=Halalkalicoccus subterraneus TaxID=2675002 RepID=UPI000EFA4F5F|nr:2Fe-2S iron-sulfur cluster-binding protein [Halalkalicoccus subterraneus]
MTHEITLEWPDDRVETFSAEEDETVLEAAARGGIRLPYDCRSGTCAECVGQVLEGSIEHRRMPRALEESDRRDGYALLCIAVPREDCRIRTGSRLTAELGSSPWS